MTKELNGFEGLGVDRYTVPQWTVELVRGPLDNRKWVDTQERAYQRLASQMELHGLTHSAVAIDEEERYILIDASEYYA